MSLSALMSKHPTTACFGRVATHAANLYPLVVHIYPDHTLGVLTGSCESPKVGMLSVPSLAQRPRDQGRTTATQYLNCARTPGTQLDFSH